MFEQITLQRSLERQPLTAGELAEALLFYQNVHVVFNETLLTQLANRIGTSVLLDVLRRPNVSAVYCHDGVLGTMTNSKGGVQLYDLVSINSTVNQKTKKAITDRTKIFEFLLKRRGGCSHFEAKRYAQALRPLVPFQRYASDDFVPGGIHEAARQDALDPAYVYEAVRRSLHALVPACPPLPRFRFDVIRVDSGELAVDSDLDFAGLTELLPPADRASGLEINPAVLLDIIFTARTELTIAAHYRTELHTWPLVSELTRLRCGGILKKVRPDLEEIASFQETIFPDGRMIKETIDSGDRSFAEFLVVLEKSSKFRDWAQRVAPEDRLVREYLAEVTSDRWISSMPVKALRFIFGAQVLLVDPSVLVGLGLTAADNLLLERLFRGWRPNHFVDNELKPFVGSGD